MPATQLEALSLKLAALRDQVELANETLQRIDVVRLTAIEHDIADLARKVDHLKAHIEIIESHQIKALAKAAAPPCLINDDSSHHLLMLQSKVRDLMAFPLR